MHADDWEIPFENISDLQWLGSGAQGAVFLGKLRGELVAIKKLRDKRETDIRHLRKLNHPNIISFKYGTSLMFITPPWEYAVVFDCMCVFVCLSASASICLELQNQSSPNFCGCYLWLWLASLVALQYFVYFSVMDDSISGHNWLYGVMSLPFQWVTLLRHRAQVNGPAVPYWLHRESVVQGLPEAELAVHHCLVYHML